MKIFERKKENSPESKNCQEIKEYLETLSAIRKINWIEEKVRTENYHFIAEKILELLPKEIKVFELSGDIHAKREGQNGKIDDSEIKDLEWVKKYSKENL